MSNQTKLSDYGGDFIIARWPAPGVLLLALNRSPMKFSTAFWRSLASNFKRVRNDPNVKVVILCSNTNSFTVGLDLKEDGISLTGTDPARKTLLFRDHIIEFQNSISTIEDCERPVIAAIHGICFGLGVDIISSCDIRVCDSETKFSIKEVDASMAADIGTLQRLPKKTGNDSLLRQLALTARTFGFKEACELGLLSESQVVRGGKEAVWTRAIELGREIAEKSPIAVLGTKHLLNYSIDHTIKDGLQYTSIWSSFALQADDVKQSIDRITSSFSNPKKNLEQINFKPLAKL
ncbi:ClpP/crotonase-like domain-containing protein [Phakopsora pachyrhizi]|uniref:ClpP/crotonase-like domain-containing protein n=1 Tax=Phakopsora pachyrhizi TaxID=170000 RepID=A0AAV0BI32_PHAPC|nr:ClpP/crotonase-like domain-containing protein [Phakopsora pachyrhizi]CAH7686230.1 ClpP/crotonase-like domain-containing protein [Phakopsora pachyrhizi]